MLRDLAVDTLMQRLGGRKDVALKNDIIAEMVIAQATVLEGDVFHPWFLLSEEATAQTTLGDERVGLPADFLFPWEYGFLYRYDSALSDPYVEMVRDDWGLIKQVLNLAGIPTHYDLAGAYIFMRPVADAVYPLRMRYIAKGADLSGVYGDGNNIENVWLKHASDWFLGEVGMVIAEQYLQMKPATVQRFQTQALRGRDRVMKLNVSMEEASKVEIKGG